VITVEELLTRSEQLVQELRRREAADKAWQDYGGRAPSRFASPSSDAEYVKALSEGRHGGSLDRRNPAGDRRFGEGRGGLTMALKTLAEGTAASGGYLVPIEYSAEITTLIRARAVLPRLGATVVPVKKELDLNALASGSTANFVAENAAIPTSEQTFSQSAFLRPRALACLVPISNRLLRDADNPAVDGIVRNDIAEVMSLRLDLAFLSGSGTGSEPNGILNTPGVTTGPNLGANGAAPTFDNLKDIVASARALNAPFQRPAWTFNPRLLSTLEKIKDGQQRYLADANLLTYDPTGTGGTLLGYPFATTTQVATNVTKGTSSDTTSIIFSSDWQEAYIGEEQGLVMEASAEASYTPDGGASWVSAFQNDQTLVRAIQRIDCAFRRPQFFVVTTGVRP